MSVVALQKRLEQIGSSDTVSFSDSFMGDEGCIMVAQALKSNPHITSLDFRGSNIHADGAVALADLLKSNKSIRFIGLEWNSIGLLDHGFQTLADVIGNSKSLVEVDLRNNGISPSASKLLAAALMKNTSITKIDLRWNNLGSTGGQFLAEAMQSNRTITEIAVAGNKISDRDLRIIEEAAARNSGRRSPIRPTPTTASSATPIKPSTMYVPSSPGVGSQMKEKLVEMSTVLLSEKEKYVSLEKKYAEDLAHQSREFERVVEALQEKSREDRSAAERAHHELQILLQNERREKEDERRLREQFEERVLAFQQDHTRLDHHHADALAALNRRMEEQANIAKEKNHEIITLKNERETLAAQLTGLHEKLRNEQAMREDLLQSHRQEMHKLAQTHHEHIRSLNTQTDQKMRVLEERLSNVESSRAQMEQELLKEKELVIETKMKAEERILQIEDRLRQEEESRLQLLDDRIRSIQTARDSLQARAEQQSFEIQELRRLETTRAKEYDQFLRRESELRSETEKVLVEKTSECERLRTEVMQAQHRLSSAEERLTRASQINSSQNETHNAAMHRAIAQHGAEKEILEKEMSALQQQLHECQALVRGKEMEIAKRKEAEAQRLSLLADNFIQHINSQVSKVQKVAAEH